MSRSFARPLLFFSVVSSHDARDGAGGEAGAVQPDGFRPFDSRAPPFSPLELLHLVGHAVPVLVPPELPEHLRLHGLHLRLGQVLHLRLDETQHDGDARAGDGAQQRRHHRLVHDKHADTLGGASRGGLPDGPLHPREVRAREPLPFARVELAVVVVVVLTQDGLRLVFDARELSVAAQHAFKSSVQRVDGERELGDIQAGFGVVAVIVVDARALLEHLLQDRVELLGQDQVHPLLLLRARVARILGGSPESLLRGRDRVVV
mmetsp:Transcript_2690/g.10698  ORF Transcript_2690/g.10698 Transcript_2690/m.10698 type:complete len:262 (+) Transcript_2690:196-981(+)